VCLCESGKSYTEIKRHDGVDDAKHWERVLREAGLSVNAGSNPKVLSYGWNDHWQDRPTFDYSLATKPKDRRGGTRKGAGRKSSCVRHLSDRCRCSSCVISAHKSKGTTTREGSDGI